jgi:hypothetical protein
MQSVTLAARKLGSGKGVHDLWRAFIGGLARRNPPDFNSGWISLVK